VTSLIANATTRLYFTETKYKVFKGGKELSKGYAVYNKAQKL